MISLLVIKKTKQLSLALTSNVINFKNILSADKIFAS